MFAFCFDYGSFAIVSFQSYLNINDVKSVSPLCLIIITASHSHSPPSSLLRLSSFRHVFVGVVNVRVVIFHICDGAFIVTSSFVRLVSLFVLHPSCMQFLFLPLPVTTHRHHQPHLCPSLHIDRSVNCFWNRYTDEKHLLEIIPKTHV